MYSLYKFNIRVHNVLFLLSFFVFICFCFFLLFWRVGNNYFFFHDTLKHFIFKRNASCQLWAPQKINKFSFLYKSIGKIYFGLNNYQKSHFDVVFYVQSTGVQPNPIYVLRFCIKMTAKDAYVIYGEKPNAGNVGTLFTLFGINVLEETNHWY